MGPTSPCSPPETPEYLQDEDLKDDSELPEKHQETLLPDTVIDDPKYIGDQILSVTSRDEQSMSRSGSSSPANGNGMAENTPAQRKYLSSRGISKYAKPDLNQSLRSPRPAYQAQQAAKPEQDQAQQQPDSGQRSSEDETDEDSEVASPLEAFDYNKIAQDYQREMEALTEKERTYWDEMADYNKLAAAWALGASNRDNFRASKRFKTREKYVQLSEETLAVKNANYAEARAAFENAIKMFKKF